MYALHKPSLELFQELASGLDSGICTSSFLMSCVHVVCLLIQDHHHYDFRMLLTFLSNSFIVRNLLLKIFTTFPLLRLRQPSTKWIMQQTARGVQVWWIIGTLFHWPPNARQYVHLSNALFNYKCSWSLTIITSMVAREMRVCAIRY